MKNVVSRVAVACLGILGAGGLAAQDGEVPGELPSVPDFVFVLRTTTPGRPDLAARAVPVERATGTLVVREQNSLLRTIVDAAALWAAPGTPTDVLDPSVSFDGERIVFSGYSPIELAWRIFEVHRSGAGLRQVTRSDAELDLDRHGALGAELAHYDDLDPCYLPDGRICFVSTRYPGFAPDGRLRATNLYVVGDDGAPPQRITTERFGADTPAVDPATGRIVYSRWWRTLQAEASTGPLPADEPGTPRPPPAAPTPIPPGSPGYGGGEGPPAPPPPDADAEAFRELLAAEARHVVSPLPLRGVAEGDFPGVNSWFLASLRPDGTDLVLHSGFRLDRRATQAYRPSFLPNGETVALFIPETPLLGVPGENGLRLFSRGAARPVELAGPQKFGAPGKVAVVYTSAEPLPDGRLLVTARRPGLNDAHHSVFVQDPVKGSGLRLVVGSALASALDAVPLVARDLPPVLVDGDYPPLATAPPRTREEAYGEGTFRFVAENIHFQGAVDHGIAGAPPVGRGLSIEFYMAPQGERTFPADPPVLLASREIPPSGKVEVELPAGVPLFELIRRTDGEIAQGRDGQIFHVGGLNFGTAGTTARCVGCHAGHTLLQVPEDPSYTNLAPSAQVTASSVREGDRPPFLRPSALVDRRTDPFVSDWAAAARDATTFVRLQWPVPLSGRSVVVYAPRPGKGPAGSTDQQIRAFRVQTFKSWFLVEDRLVEEPIRVEGTAVPLDPSKEFDAVAIAIEGRFVSGTYVGGAGPALAEIEVIARALGTTAAIVEFARGDVNCDASVNLADAVALLGSLFQGQDASCCREANDANRDLAIDLADPIFLLNFLFLGGERIPAPSPGCGRAEAAGFGCDEEICP